MAAVFIAQVFSFICCAALITGAHSLEFLVQPKNETVALNSIARFNCVVRGDNAYVNWIIDDLKVYGIDNHILEEEYTAIWHTEVNTSLEITAVKGTNGTKVQCMAGNIENHDRSETGHLIIAAAPLTPDGVNISYNIVDTSIMLQWKEPFTHLPEFPILYYTANVEYWGMDQTFLKIDSLNISGTRTELSFQLNDNEVCNSDRICISLIATNNIGDSRETSVTCTVIEREHKLTPVNATLITQPDGQTLVSVLFQVPPCFPSPMHSNIVIEEASPLQSPVDINAQQLLLPTEDAILMESHKMVVMEQDVVYSIIVQLTSQSENVTSQPIFVMPSPQAQDNGKDDNGESGDVVLVAVLVGVLLLFILITTALATSIAVVYIIHRNNKDTIVVNQMQPNPLYENTYYDSISESYTLPRTNTPPYESHIYQDMPELVQRLQANGDLPSCSTQRHIITDQCCPERDEVEEMKRVQCTTVGCGEVFEQVVPEVVVEGEREVGEGERESEYVTMQSVTDTISPLQTDV